MNFSTLTPLATKPDYAQCMERIEAWFHHAVLENPGDLSVPANDPFQNPFFRKIEEMTRAALARCGDRYWVGYTDLHPGLDCMAAWRGVAGLCMDRVIYHVDGKGVARHLDVILCLGVEEGGDSRPVILELTAAENAPAPARAPGCLPISGASGTAPTPSAGRATMPGPPAHQVSP